MPVSRNSVPTTTTDPADTPHPMRGFPTPYWSAPGAALYLGDVRECLRSTPARSVHCVVTSPPYWGLRSYLPTDHEHKGHEIGAEPSPDCGTHGQAQCGACFVCAMVGVFREVYRVLRDDGTCWLNLGDTYGNPSNAGNRNEMGGSSLQGGLDYGRGCDAERRDRQRCLSSGNIVGIPWRVALALQADGWVLRQDIIWYSPNKMPESVQNRCTKSHEYIFLLAKGSGYYFDSVAIQEEMTSRPRAPGRVREDRVGQGAGGNVTKPGKVWGADGNKNKRDVWIVPTQGYPGAHFATFSPKLITPCILAGTSEHGVCADCGTPWERLVVRTGGEAADGDAEARDRSFPSQRNGLPGSGSTLDGTVARKETVGWYRVCGCLADVVVPAVVLDPFVGSGTTVATALELGRAGVGIDLSETYLRENAVPRIEEVVRGGLSAQRRREHGTVAAPNCAPLAPKRMRGA